MALSSFGSFTFIRLFLRLFNFNSRPIAQNQTEAVSEGNVLNGQLVGSDPNGDSITFQLLPNQVILAGFTFNADGSYSFDATVSEYEGLNTNDTESFTFNYVVKDSRGAISQTRTLTINLTGY
ncbi:Ig-like domain-containing protein [Synechococcus elongatus]|uniref:Ig-like domain-containing protein n=1 Tax=Synechococcus elongatus TaxID=32046 RepID=UPI001EDD3D72|nr:Ig-like domain-containing protein [Synechococcus elongatus]